MAPPNRRSPLDRRDDQGDRSRFDLWRVLGTPFGLAVVIGGSIGSGILRAPGAVAAALPSAPLLVLFWLLGGLLALIEALPLIELATALPRVGGPIVYVERAFGHLAGTLTGWCSWLQCVVSLAFMAVVFGEFARRVFITMPVGLSATVLILTSTAMNLADTRTSGRIQTIGVLLKLAGLLFLMAMLCAVPPALETADSATPVLSLGGAVVALMLVNNTYQGWSAIVPFAEEMRDPGRTLVRAMFGGLAIITVIYVLMNVILLRALPFTMLIRSTLPAGDAMARLAGPLADHLITIFSLISVMAIVNITTMIPARILLAMARTGSAPSVFTHIGRNGSPYAATLAGGLFASLLASSGAYIALNALYAPLAIITTIAVLLSAWRLRRTEPALVRPFRMPGHPIPLIVALTINVGLLTAFVAATPLEALASLGLIALGLPLSRWHSWRKNPTG